MSKVICEPGPVAERLAPRPWVFAFPKAPGEGVSKVSKVTSRGVLIFLVLPPEEALSGFLSPPRVSLIPVPPSGRLGEFTLRGC